MARSAPMTTVTSTVPATWTPVTALMVVASTTCAEAADAPPSVTVAPAEKFTPEIVTAVPPRVVPCDGVMAVTLMRLGDGPLGELPQAASAQHTAITPHAAERRTPVPRSDGMRLELSILQQSRDELTDDVGHGRHAEAHQEHVATAGDEAPSREEASCRADREMRRHADDERRPDGERVIREDEERDERNDGAHRRGRAGDEAVGERGQIRRLDVQLLAHHRIERLAGVFHHGLRGFARALARQPPRLVDERQLLLLELGHELHLDTLGLDLVSVHLGLALRGEVSARAHGERIGQ